MAELLTLGVEEELQILDGESLALTSKADELLVHAPAGELMAEMPRSQVEAVTTVCSTLSEVREQVERRRAIASAAAVSAGLRVASCGTAPLADWRINKARTEPPYTDIVERAGHLVDEQLIAGLHVHIGIEDMGRAVGALDRIRDWLPVLLAMSASSPYWSGHDSGFASFRAVHWRRWPVSGPAPHFGSAEGYVASVQRLVESGVIGGERAVYWDARRSARFPTVEVRVCDAVQTVDEVVALTGLIRGLVAAGLDEHDRGAPLAVTDHAVLNLANWTAARSGLTGSLLMDGHAVPAETAVRALVERVGPYLGSDAPQVLPVVERMLADGGGATRQRRAALDGGLPAAAELVVAETMAGVDRVTLPRVAKAGVLDPDERRLAAERPPHH